MAEIKVFTADKGTPGKDAANEEYYAPGDIKRIFPIDDYRIDSRLIARATRYHFLKVPLLGQSNPKTFHTDQYIWCGRTSSTMIRNYNALIGGKISRREDYVTHFDPTEGQRQLDVPWEMDLRKDDHSIAFSGYALSRGLDHDAKDAGLGDPKAKAPGYEDNRFLLETPKLCGDAGKNQARVRLAADGRNRRGR